MTGAADLPFPPENELRERPHPEGSEAKSRDPEGLSKSLLTP